MLDHDVIRLILNFTMHEGGVYEDMPDREAAKMYTDMLWGNSSALGLKLLKSLYTGSQIRSGFLQSFESMLSLYLVKDSGISFNTEILFSLWEDENWRDTIPHKLPEAVWYKRYTQCQREERTQMLAMFKVPKNYFSLVLTDLGQYSAETISQEMFGPMLRVLKSKLGAAILKEDSELSRNLQFSIQSYIEQKIERYTDLPFMWIIHDLKRSPDIGEVLLQVGILNILSRVILQFSTRNDVVTESLRFLISFRKMCPEVVNYYHNTNLCSTINGVLQSYRSNILYHKAIELKLTIDDLYYLSPNKISVNN